MDFVSAVRNHVDFRKRTLSPRKNNIPFDRIILIFDAVIEPLEVSVVFVQCETPVSVYHCC
jgi:hypothetical protein